MIFLCKFAHIIIHSVRTDADDTCARPGDQRFDNDREFNSRRRWYLLYYVINVNRPINQSIMNIKTTCFAFNYELQQEILELFLYSIFVVYIL